MSSDLDIEEELAQRKLDRRTLGRLGAFLWPYRWPIGLTLTMEAGWVAAVLCEPHLVKVAIDDKIAHGDVDGLLVVVGLLVLTGLVRVTLDVIELGIMWWAGHRVLADIRRAVFEHVHSLSMRYFDRTRQGRIIARVDRDVDTLERPLVWGPLTVVSCTLRWLLALSMMLWYDAALCGVVSLTLVPLLVATEVFRRRGMRAYRRVREALARVTAHLAESVSGVRVIQAFGQEARNLETFSGHVREHQAEVQRAAYVWSAYHPAIGLTHGLAAVLVLAVGGAWCASGRMGVGELSAFVLLLTSFFGPMEWLGDLYNSALFGAAAAERIFLLLDTPPEIVDRPGAAGLPRLAGGIRFENVWFRYDRPAANAEAGAGADAHAPAEAQAWTVREIDFEAVAGQTVALVGPTGAGKSTIVNLLCRFYEPTRGRVLLDGHDLGACTLESLYRQIAVVPQDAFLFEGTVLENLRYGRPSATEAEARACMERIGAGWLLEKLPGGLGARVGERGTGLSAGERQLLCVARALLADPAILVLDEATSALDTRSERALQHALAVAGRGRTAVVIAHRLSTIRRADLILVVTDGRIVERGTHRELLAAHGAYAEMVKAYARAPRDGAPRVGAGAAASPAAAAAHRPEAEAAAI
ncbi:MAG: ABC transporter ATP-binding protein [Planctomycetes bacterium]|nr:ABC transporter ATP-binding protein [Planctomycetota bacterium]